MIVHGLKHKHHCVLVFIRPRAEDHAISVMCSFPIGLSPRTTQDLGSI